MAAALEGLELGRWLEKLFYSGLRKANSDWDRLNDHKLDGFIDRIPYVCQGVPRVLYLLTDALNLLIRIRVGEPYLKCIQETHHCSTKSRWQS